MSEPYRQLFVEAKHEPDRAIAAMSPAQRARDDVDKNRLRISPLQFWKAVRALGVQVLPPTDEHPYDHFRMTAFGEATVIASDPHIREWIP